VNIIECHEALQEIFLVLFVYRVHYVIHYSNIGASKEEGNYAYYLGVGGQSLL
jgi:hypothetical protein